MENLLNSWSEVPNYFNRDHMAQCFYALNNLRKQSQFCDVFLIAGSSPLEQTEADSQPDDERLEIPAHRAILAASCPYFYAMFTNDMAESNQREIYIQGVNPRALEVIIEYIYTSTIHITEENVQVILPAANLLQLNDVRHACCEFLKSQLHPSNCLGIRAFADLHSCRDLVNYASIFIEQHFNDIVQTDEFLNLTFDHFIQLIANDKLTANEEAIFESVVIWIRYEAERRKNYLAEIMEHVRLPLLNQQYLIEKVECEPLVRENSRCKDYLIEAFKFHLLNDEQKKAYVSPRTRPRMPQISPKLMLVVGGQAPKAIRSVDVYDFQTQLWSQIAELPMRRCRCGVVNLNGIVYAIGGFNGSLRVRTVDMYDPYKDVWIAAPSMETRRATLGVGVLEGEIYAVGGFDGSSGLNNAEAYDPRSGQWRTIAPMSTRRSSVGVAVLNGLVYAIGGYDGLSRQCLMTVERYDKRANRWTTIAHMEERRSGPGVAVLDNKLYALGGHDGPIVKRSCEVYDWENDLWRPISDMVRARRNAGVCAFNSSLYSVGGDDGNSHLASVEVYDSKANAWSLLPCGMPLGRSYASVVIISKPS